MSEAPAVGADLFLIGAPKAGTTSIAGWLGAHPEIYWSVPKEPNFWSADFARLRAHHGFAERSAYDRLFDSDEARRARWRGDGSTTYLYSERAVPDILAERPDARFVICLRRHDELVPSYHRTELTALNETETDVVAAWGRAVRGEPAPGNPLDAKLVDYPLIGAIGAATARVAAQVPKDQLALVLFDDIKGAPEATYRRLLEFLGVDPGHDLDLTALNSSDKAARLAALRRITHRPPPWLAPTMTRVRQWSRTSTFPGLQRVKAAAWRQADRPDVPPGFGAELREFFADDLRLLESVLERRLDHWRVPSSS